MLKRFAACLALDRGQDAPPLDARRADDRGGGRAVDPESARAAGPDRAGARHRDSEYHGRLSE